VGNLTILKDGKNSSLGNRDWNYKKERFSTGSYNEIFISKNVNWSVRTIKERGVDILDFWTKKLGCEDFTDDEKESLLFYDTSIADACNKASLSIDKHLNELLPTEEQYKLWVADLKNDYGEDSVIDDSSQLSVGIKGLYYKGVELHVRIEQDGNRTFYGCCTSDQSASAQHPNILDALKKSLFTLNLMSEESIWYAWRYATPWNVYAKFQELVRMLKKAMIEDEE
jgi:hypothetical protein